MILGLHGRLQAGKDTTMERIRRLSSMPVEHLSFAAPLKESAAALFGITLDELEAMKLDPSDSISVRVPGKGTFSFSGRTLLQRYGTESHRDIFGQNFWVDQCLSKATDPNTLYVITDVRFSNEALSILDYGGFIVHVVGPQGKAEGDHPSEQALDDRFFTYEINNSKRDDNFYQLDVQVWNLLAKLRISVKTMETIGK